MLKNIAYVIKKPGILFMALGYRGLLNWMSDEQYLKTAYRINTGKTLNLRNPRTFNEKIQWLKLYDRQPIYTILVDKYKVKKYVSERIGSKYIISTLGVWDSFDDIDFSLLPNRFVLKCTHDSGGVVICKDKSSFNISAAKRKINKCLKRNYYWAAREWPYKNVKPRIIAEEYIEEEGHFVPEDYKVYCINGEPKYIVVFHNRFNKNKHLSETVYTKDWKPQHISLDSHFKISDDVIPRPECLDELLQVCKNLSEGLPQVRIDFYIIKNTIYFGEITLYTASGFQPMIPEKVDGMLGDELMFP